MICLLNIEYELIILTTNVEEKYFFFWNILMLQKINKNYCIILNFAKIIINLFFYKPNNLNYFLNLFYDKILFNN